MDSLLLMGLPGTGKTHLAGTIVARLEQGEAVRRCPRKSWLVVVEKITS